MAFGRFITTDQSSKLVKNKLEQSTDAGKLSHIESEVSGFADIHLTFWPRTASRSPHLGNPTRQTLGSFYEVHLTFKSREARLPRAIALHVKSNDDQPPSTSQKVRLLVLLWRLHKFMHRSSKYMSWTVIRLISPD